MPRGTKGEGNVPQTNEVTISSLIEARSSLKVRDQNPGTSQSFPPTKTKSPQPFWCCPRCEFPKRICSCEQGIQEIAPRQDPELHPSMTTQEQTWWAMSFEELYQHAKCKKFGKGGKYGSMQLLRAFYFPLEMPLRI
jgi:hypothetical protein